MGEIPRPLTGALVADRSGVTTPYALYDLQQREELLVGAGTEVNEGTTIAETSRRKRSRRQRHAPMRRSALSQTGR
jgi:predicted membrane GTPase involved in stress response